MSDTPKSMWDDDDDGEPTPRVRQPRLADFKVKFTTGKFRVVRASCFGDAFHQVRHRTDIKYIQQISPFTT